MEDLEPRRRSGNLTEDIIADYLKSNPRFLESWVMEKMDLDTLERWMIRKAQRDKNKQQDPNGKITRKTSLSRWKFCVHADKRKMLQELTSSLQSQPNQSHVLWELSQCVSSAVSAEGLHLYIAYPSCNVLTRYYGEENEQNHDDGSPKEWPMQDGQWICSWVAHSRQTVRVAGPSFDPRFPKGSPYSSSDVYHLLAIPVIQSNGELAAVLELYRKESGDPFYEEDEEIVNSYLVWGGIALHYAELYHGIAKQRKLNDFMLSVVKSIFQDMVSMDAVIMKVMNFAQSLVNADRASLFLVDSKNKQLYARIFDMGSSNPDQLQATKEIRFSIGTGIAGNVAQTGEVMNIHDAYSDPRFNRSVDQLTGYVTKSILCMPIFIRNHVIGVMQMVNKSTGIFTREDEESFEMFANYCGLALHHAKLYDKIRRSEQKYKVALEIMSYHANCAEDEYSSITKEEIPENISGIECFKFSPLEVSDMDKVRQTIFMFVDLFGLVRFDKDALVRFCLTVRKNYRRVPYHNWAHGFGVANAMYSIIKHSPKTFKPLECLSLFIGALCHDLDHRGKNNKFLSESDSPLATIYTTSTLEHHHFNQTVTILQQDGHNIFSKLTASEYKQVLGNLKHCILATDLASFFINKAKLSDLIEKDSFCWKDPEHRMILQAVAMTGCDLSASTKPWEAQEEIVKVIFDEFYEQGDAERAAGRIPIPMMDRTKPEERPGSQVGFLSGICIPCYDLIATLIPQAAPLLEGCKKNLEIWKNMCPQPTEQEIEHPCEQETEHPTEQETEHSTEQETEHPTKLETEHPTENTTERTTEHSTENTTEHPTEQEAENPTENKTEHTTKRPNEDPNEHPTRHST